MGHCDELTGLCACRAGWEGPACERLSCPTHNGLECSGSGRCMSMRDAAAEFRFRHKLGIHVMRKEIARVAGMHDEIGLGDGASVGLARLADPDFLEAAGSIHQGASSILCMGCAEEA